LKVRNFSKKKGKEDLFFNLLDCWKLGSNWGSKRGLGKRKGRKLTQEVRIFEGLPKGGLAKGV